MPGENQYYQADGDAVNAEIRVILNAIGLPSLTENMALAIIKDNSGARSKIVAELSSGSVTEADKGALANIIVRCDTSEKQEAFKDVLQKWGETPSPNNYSTYVAAAPQGVSELVGTYNARIGPVYAVALEDVELAQEIKTYLIRNRGVDKDSNALNEIVSPDYQAMLVLLDPSDEVKKIQRRGALSAVIKHCDANIKGKQELKEVVKSAFDNWGEDKSSMNVWGNKLNQAMSDHGFKAVPGPMQRPGATFAIPLEGGTTTITTNNTGAVLGKAGGVSGFANIAEARIAEAGKKSAGKRKAPVGTPKRLRSNPGGR